MNIILKIVDVFEYVYKNNIIYRDVKFDNILIIIDNIIKLIDFGIVKILDLLIIINFNKIMGFVYYFFLE